MLLGMDENCLIIGTCSWKYDSWQGVIYPDRERFNYLHEYSQHYRSVEVDQWFWSLFEGSRPVLPKVSVVREYGESVSEDFVFCVKVPNSITLTHHYKKRKSDPLRANSHFLSLDLMDEFLKRLEPIGTRLGPLIFQFEYLNKMKMSGPGEFLDRFGCFVEKLPPGYHYCLESRNPNYLKNDYFDFLHERQVSHVFLQGYYMPSIFDLYKRYREKIANKVVVRLHGPDRKGIEKETGKNWSRIVQPKDKELQALGAMIADMQSRGVQPFIYVNNHYEGSAPRTIARFLKGLNPKLNPFKVNDHPFPGDLL